MYRFTPAVVEKSQPVMSGHCVLPKTPSIELVEVVSEGIAAGRHRADHAQDTQATALDLAKRDTERHHTSRQRAAGHSRQHRSADER